MDFFNMNTWGPNANRSMGIPPANPAASSGYTPLPLTSLMEYGNSPSYSLTGQPVTTPDFSLGGKFNLGGTGPKMAGLGNNFASSMLGDGGAGGPAATPGIFGSIGKWMEDSGFLGKKLADGTRVDGWGGLAIGGASALGNAYMGMKQYNLAKQQFGLQKDAFNFNKKNMIEDRDQKFYWRDRGMAESSGAKPGSFASFDDWRKQYGYKG